MFAPDPPLRRRGCQLPLSALQVAVVAFYAALAALTFVAIALCASPFSQSFLYPLQAALCGTVILCYLVCSLSDVTTEGGIPCICVATSQGGEPHYCRQSGGKVPGYDHFCVFLNVAVGKKTYFWFYMMALLGFSQFLWQVCSMVVIAAGPWLSTDGAGPLPQDSKRAFAGVMALLGIVGVVTFGSLFFFHTCVPCSARQFIFFFF